jgi:hypothetical protein
MFTVPCFQALAKATLVQPKATVSNMITIEFLVIILSLLKKH